MKLTLVPTALAVVALSLTPATAKSKNKHWHHDRSQQYHQAWGGEYQGRGWNSRNVSDPSFGNRAGINNARRTGRCVADLGYGRYEYCGW